jgi:hypothetical protein
MTTASTTSRLYILLPLIVFVAGVGYLSPELGESVRASCQAQCRQVREQGMAALRQCPLFGRP